MPIRDFQGCMYSDAQSTIESLITHTFYFVPFKPLCTNSNRQLHLIVCEIMEGNDNWLKGLGKNGLKKDRSRKKMIGEPWHNRMEWNIY